jgi:hypothetical protein
MKKILLSAGMLFLAVAAQAQDCKAVATLNEDFGTFATGVSFPLNCWTASQPYPSASVSATFAAQIYSSDLVEGTPIYLVTPELTTLDGKHSLSYDAKLSNGTNITVQVGTLASPTDYTTFVGFGEPITLTRAGVPQKNLVLPASTTQKYIAFKVISSAKHNVSTIDNVVWDEVPAPTCEAVATLDENFNAFKAATSGAFPQNCWTASSGAGLPLVYTVAADATNTYVTFYTSTTGKNIAGYLVTPEISTLDGKHALSFDTYKLGGGPSGEIPAGNVTVQIGTLSDPADFTTFKAFGDAIPVTNTSVTHKDIVLPTTTDKYIAFKLLGDTDRNAASLDNIKWAAKTAGVDGFAKNKFSIFPNPSSDKNVTIAYAGADKANVTVFSLTGAKVFETIVNGTNANLNLSSLSSGMYIVKLTAGNATATQKLVI